MKWVFVAALTALAGDVKASNVQYVDPMIGEWVSEWVSVCVCVCERERVSEWVCVCVCVSEWVCVCVSESSYEWFLAHE